ncbi:hypothetical protein EJ06DRAFT_529546, partial [Trichodelitschia bisporula]
MDLKNWSSEYSMAKAESPSEQDSLTAQHQTSQHDLKSPNPTMSPSTPRFSLWLVPPPGSHSNMILSQLIKETIPNSFSPLCASPPLVFEPHITLITGLTASTFHSPDLSSSPQSWLDALNLPPAPEVHFASIGFGSEFTKRFFVRVKRVELERLREACGEGVDVTADSSDKELNAMFRGLLEDCVSEFFGLREGSPELKGWPGGELWVVETSRPIKDWQPVAVRKLKH